MSQNSLSKQRKRKVRERRVAEKKREQDDYRRYTAAFPRFVFRPNNAPDGFVELIRGAVRRIDFRDRKLFHPAEATFLRLAKQKPVEVFSALLAGGSVGVPQSVYLSSFVGQTVFRTIPAADLRRWIPFHDVRFLLAGKEIVVDFRSLEQSRGPGGTIYFSGRRPTLEIDGQKKVVAWSRHAITRTCERLAPRWDSYLGLGDVFAFFDRCAHFERADLYGGQLGFSFYDLCAPGFFSSLFAKTVLGGLGAKPCYYRVGYCPAVVEGDFLKATTLLYPGYRGTPEYGLMVNSRLPLGEQTRLAALAGEQTRAQLELTGDFGLVKWFHDRGVTQVVETDEDYYAPPG